MAAPPVPGSACCDPFNVAGAGVLRSFHDGLCPRWRAYKRVVRALPHRRHVPGNESDLRQLPFRNRRGSGVGETGRPRCNHGHMCRLPYDVGMEPHRLHGPLLREGQLRQLPRRRHRDRQAAGPPAVERAVRRLPYGHGVDTRRLRPYWREQRLFRLP